jgi:hypothetical protein
VTHRAKINQDSEAQLSKYKNEIQDLKQQLQVAEDKEQKLQDTEQKLSESQELDLDSSLEKTRSEEVVRETRDDSSHGHSWSD